MKQSKKLTLITFIIFITLTIISTPSCTKPAPQEKTIKIGAILPLTGAASWLGENSKVGLELAVKTANMELKNAGKKVSIELIVYDSKLLPKEAVALTQRLINNDGVRIIIATGTTIINSIYPITEENNIILFAQTIHPFITKLGENIYRLYGGGDIEWRYLANYINQSQLTKIGIMYINAQYGLDCIKLFKESLQDKIQIDLEIPYEIGNTDFRNILIANLDRIKKLDGIILMGYGTEYIPLLKQFTELKIDQKILGNIDFTYDFLVKYPPAEGAIFVAPYFSLDSSSPKASQFVKLYSRNHASIPSWDIANSYDTIMVIKKILENSKHEFDHSTFSEVFQTLNDLEGVSGKLIIDKKLKEFYIPLELAIIKNQKIIALKE